VEQMEDTISALKNLAFSAEELKMIDQVILG
jgi:hypothetical protein